MNADLKATLAEMGADASFVDALRGACACHVDPGFASRVETAVRDVRAQSTVCWWTAAAAAAALLAVSVSFLLPRGDSKAGRLPSVQMSSASSLTPHVQAFVVSSLAKGADASALTKAVDALVSCQSAEGGWTNPEMSARNVAALTVAVSAGVTSAKSALCRGRRYLRANGIPELDAVQFEREARHVRELLGG